MIYLAILNSWTWVDLPKELITLIGRHAVGIRRKWLGPLIAFTLVLFGAGIFASHFTVLRTRDDIWLSDRRSGRICTIGLEALERPCSSALAAVLARIGLVRPDGADWSVGAIALRAPHQALVGGCVDQSVWYIDRSGNIFVSDTHAYATRELRFEELSQGDSVKICARQGGLSLYTLRLKSGRSVTAVRLR
jgi:hypothetical protein